MTDTLARNIGTMAAETLGKPVIVDNKPGVGGSLVSEFVAKAPPDGHTLLLTLSATLAVSAAVYSKLKYDPRNDLQCVTEVCLSRGVLVVNSDLPIRDLKELVGYSKAHPDQLAMANWGLGSAAHTTQNVLNTHFGARIMQVPYKGEMQIITDLIGGRVGFAMLSAPATQAHLKGGKIRPIAIVGTQRLDILPDVKTTTEQGFHHESWDMDGPVGVFAPRGTPPRIVRQLNEAMVPAIKTPRMQAFLKEFGLLPLGNGADAAQAHFLKYFDAIKKVTQETGVILD
jgi:tripartite-type tricarboxylate transporter receptor subunit TctC